MTMMLASLLPDQRLPETLAGTQITSLAVDSRQVQAGGLFFAMPGVNVDGRRFIDDAIDAGAAIVLEEGEQEGLRSLKDIPVMTMPDLHRHLGFIAARFFGEPAANMNMIGVTGTNGKSSVAWFAQDALNAIGQACALIGTLGIQFGDWQQAATHTTPDPISLQGVLGECHDRGAQAVVMEVSSHALVQQRANGVPFSSAIFTNLSRDHLDYHGDMESYFAAKMKLFEWPGLALAVVNVGDHWGQRVLDGLPAGCRAVTYGGDDAMVRCLSSVFSRDGMELELDVAGERLALSLPLFGAFNRDNVLAVAALLHGSDVTGEQLRTGLSHITAVPGRMQPVDSAFGPKVIVDYAHTPDALEKALRACRQHFSGKLYCVVGCGGNRDQGKRPMMAAAAAELADAVVLTSDNPRDEVPSIILEQMQAGVPVGTDVDVIEDRAQAITHAVAHAGEHDLVLIAGKGHENYQEIAGQRTPFDDVQVARSALLSLAKGVHS